MKPRRLLLDSEVLLDVLLERTEEEDAARLWARVELGAAEGLVTATGLADIHAAANELRGPAFALRLLRELLQVFRVARVDGKIVERAVEISRRDFGAALLAVAAHDAKCHAVVTRRKMDAAPDLACLSPAEALAALR